MQIPEYVKNIVEKLESAGFEAFVVGGCVRDLLMDKKPKGIDSWRGIYSELAIQTEDFGSYKTEEVEDTLGGDILYKYKSIGKESPTVAEWIDVLEEVVGKIFTGYKGGDFVMGRGTPVYLAEQNPHPYIP